VIPLSQAWAGGWRHGGGHGGHGGHGPRVFIGTSFWWGPPYPYYYPYYYPYPYTVYAPAPAPVIVEQPVYTQQPAAAPEGYWYYCESSKAYYPNVPMCTEAWIKVPPRSE
jgi:hypothetical protein